MCIFYLCKNTTCKNLFSATITEYLLHDLLLQLHHGLSKHGYVISLLSPARSVVFSVVLLPIPSLAGSHVVSLGKQLTNVQNFFPGHTV